MGEGAGVPRHPGWLQGPVAVCRVLGLMLYCRSLEIRHSFAELYISALCEASIIYKPGYCFCSEKIHAVEAPSNWPNTQRDTSLGN